MGRRKKFSDFERGSAGKGWGLGRYLTTSLEKPPDVSSFMDVDMDYPEPRKATGVLFCAKSDM